MRSVLARHADASVTVVPIPGGGVDAETAKRFPILAARTAVDGKATSYLCRHGACQAPTTDPDELARQLH